MNNIPPREAVAAWVQTRVVLRIVLLLLAIAALLWSVYRLTTVLLLWCFRSFSLTSLRLCRSGEQRTASRPEGISDLARSGHWHCLPGALCRYWRSDLSPGPAIRCSISGVQQQAVAYYKTITTASDRINQYFMQHRMPEGVVKAVNDTVLGLIAHAAQS